MPTPSAPFTRREALLRGTTPGQLAGPTHQRLIRAVYLTSNVPDTTLQRARAVLKITPAGSYISHHTAVALWGGRPPEQSATHVSVVAGTRSVRRGVRAHRAPRSPEVSRHCGLPISSPEQSFLDLATAGVGLVDLVVAGDSLVKAGVTTVERLIEAAGAGRRWGVRTARRAARLVRADVDSATESRLRMLIVLAGLPEPEVNHILRHEDGSWRWRLDLSYPALGLIVEYDGHHHSDDRRQRAKDLRRREELEREGWRFIVITADDLFNRPLEALGRIWTALRDRGATGLPVRRAAAWSQEFLVR